MKDQAGALYHMLRPFYENHVNLTKIESRPLKRKAWEYVFFIDLEGHVQDPEVKARWPRWKACQFLKVLGSYPRAENPRLGRPRVRRTTMTTGSQRGRCGTRFAPLVTCT